MRVKDCMLGSEGFARRRTELVESIGIISRFVILINTLHQLLYLDELFTR